MKLDKPGQRLKQLKPAGPTIAGWLWLAFGLLVLVLIVSFIIYYWHNQRLDDHLDVMNLQESRQQTVLDMRFDAAGINGALSDYMRDKDLGNVENVRDFEAAFEANQERLTGFAENEEMEATNLELDNLYEAYKDEADDTIELTDRHYAALSSFTEYAAEIREVISGLDEAVIDADPPDPEALIKLESTRVMLSSIDQMFISISDYIAEPGSLLVTQIDSAQADFEAAHADYEGTTTSSYENTLLDHIKDDAFAGLSSDIDDILTLTDSLNNKLDQYQQSYQALDTYFTGQVLPSAEEEVTSAREEQADLSSLADIWLICLIIFGALTGGLAAYLMSRRIILPVKDLIKGAKRVESGRIDHRFNIDAKGELGQVAVALNRMLNSLDRIHKALEQSEEQAWALLDVTSDIVILTDTRGNILASNELAAEKFGMSLEQIINESIYNQLPAASAITLKMHIDEAIRLKRPIHYEDEQEGKIIDQNVLPMLNAKGEVNRIAVFSRDVTVHKWVEDVTVQYGRRYELILQAAGEGIFGLDTQGITTFVNPAAARMLGYEPEELIGKRHHELVHYSRPDGRPYPSEQCPIYASFKDGMVHSNVDNEVFWRKDGTNFPVSYTSTPIIEDDLILGAVITFRDISSR